MFTNNRRKEFFQKDGEKFYLKIVNTEQTMREQVELISMLNRLATESEIDLDKMIIQPLVNINITSGSFTNGNTLIFNVELVCLAQRDINKEVRIDDFWEQDNEIDNLNETHAILNRMWLKMYRDFEKNNITASENPRLRVYKKLLSDDSSVSPTLMITENSITVTNAVMEYTKERIVMCVNDKVYEFSSSATSLPAAVYSHNDPDHIFTSITSSGAAIYISGYSGIQSNIYKFTLSTAGAMPTLTSAITAAELPVGEIVFKIAYYLGNMAIGTSQGMRMADASQLDGSITYGALIFESTQPVYDFGFRDRYIWAASGVDGQVGVTRVDMGQPLGNLQFPYACDLYDPADTLGHYTTACAFLGDTNRLAFCNAGNGADGAIYIESASTLLEEGFLRTGYVRYNTLELKIYKLMQARIDTTNGGLLIDSVDYADNFYRIGTFAQQALVPEININYPQASQEYLGFQFTLTRSTTDVTKGPLFTGYQIKALPAIPRQRLIQYPLSCFDHESDHFGVEIGYEGSAYFRMSQLESIENVGDTIRVEDFRTGESYIGLIEELDFRNATPSDKRFSGYGGTLLVTIRTV